MRSGKVFTGCPDSYSSNLVGSFDGHKKKHEELAKGLALHALE